jgi:uncharacterized protein YgbK (DUF1537 family)
MKRCLIIADDLTGGADSGAKFAERGLRTLLVSLRKGGGTIDCAAYPGWDVLVVNTDTRGASPEVAANAVSRLLRSYSKELFPLIYKKIDSTLRGNIGAEMDAILAATSIPLAFFAPSFPEQSRAVVGGILVVDGSPLALADLTREGDPATDSHVEKILARQSSHPTCIINLHQVAAGADSVLDAVLRESREGRRVLIFDAIQRRDLAHIAEAAFRMGEVPLFVGSAGLAEEVARIMARPMAESISGAAMRLSRPLSRVIIISGSQSGVARGQIEHIEGAGNVRPFELDRTLLQARGDALTENSIRLARSMGEALETGHVLLKACPSAIDFPGMSNKITTVLGKTVRFLLDSLGRDAEPVALVITGGATAASVFNSIEAEGFELCGEVVDGIAFGRVVGGRWNGLATVTKAGGFGKRDCFAGIIDALEQGVSSPLSP